MPANESRQEQPLSPPKGAPAFVVTHRLVFSRGGSPGGESASFSDREIDDILEWLLCGNRTDSCGSDSQANNIEPDKTSGRDNDPVLAGSWLQISFGVIDLVRALRGLGFREAFVETAVVEFIRANPLDHSRPTPEVYVLSDAENEAVKQAGQVSEGRK